MATTCTHPGPVATSTPFSSLSAKVAVLDAIICLTWHDIKRYKYGPLFVTELIGGVPHRGPLLAPFMLSADESRNVSGS